jgi:hypothetical protein
MLISENERFNDLLVVEQDVITKTNRKLRKAKRIVFLMLSLKKM